MVSAMDMYNKDVMATTCPYCDAGPNERCKPRSRDSVIRALGHITVPHSRRIKAAKKTRA